MSEEYQKQIEQDLDAFFDSVILHLEDIRAQVFTIIEMMEALHEAECFNELADLVEELLKEGESYELFHNIIERWPKSKDFTEEMVALVCERDLISPKDLEIISTWADLIWDHDSDDYIRSKCGMATAACNPRTEPNVLKKIAMDCSWEIACRVAANPRTDWETLFSLAKKVVDNESGFKEHETASVIVTMFIRTDVSEATLYKLRNLISNHEVVELMDKYLADKEDDQLLRYLL
jgi:hypothetical protein